MYQSVRCTLNQFIVLLLATLVFQLNCFNLKLEPINSLDLSKVNQTYASVRSLFKYPQQVEPFERFEILEIDKNKNYLILGARNRAVTINSNNFDQIQTYESYFPIKNQTIHERNCEEKTCSNYLLSSLPISKSSYNSLICGTYFGLFQCVEAKKDSFTGIINAHNAMQLVRAPKFITLPNNNKNAYFLSNASSPQQTQDQQYILYAASSLTDNSQYLAAHTSNFLYQDDFVNKKIGVSKSFVRFVESNNKLFLFQNEHSYDVDDGEKDRDILISTSLVTQFCKNDDEILRKDMAFYSELTAKIYCFNKAFKSNSGNTRNFKFDSLQFVTNLIDLKEDTKNNSAPTRQLFYGVFNTPKNQITGTAICFFDINDLESVFNKNNFKFLENYDTEAAKNTALNPEKCDKLSYLEKTKYKSFTSKLSYMTKAALPVRKRKASFITTNEYRITCLYVVDNLAEYNMQPAVRKLDKYDFLHVIYAGTDDGKLMRIAHHFSRNYFLNDELDEEHVEILEEIQLFDKNTTINEISILNNQRSKRIFVIANKQVKSIPIDFCELYSESCEKCLEHNVNKFYSSKCYWVDNACKSSLKMSGIQSIPMEQQEHCRLLKQSSTTTTTTTTTTTSTTTSKPISTFTSSLNSSKKTPKVLNHYNSKESFNSPRETTKHAQPDSGTTKQPKLLLNSFASRDELERKKGDLDESLQNIDLNSFIFNEFLSKKEQNGVPFNPKSGQFSLENMALTKEKADQRRHLSQFFIVLSIVISLIALFVGVMIGYLIKTKYSRQILKQFDFVRKFKKENQKFSIYASSISSGEGVSASVSASNNTSSNSRDKQTDRCIKTKLNNYDQGSKMRFGNSIATTASTALQSETSRTNSLTNDDSFGSTKSTNYCASNASSTDSAGNFSRQSSKGSADRGIMRASYYTVQNDYGILPKLLHNPIHQLTSLDATNVQRFSTTSISTSTIRPTDANVSYGVYNLLNSQACLLNRDTLKFDTLRSKSSKLVSDYSNLPPAPALPPQLPPSTTTTPIQTIASTVPIKLSMSDLKAPIYMNENCLIVDDDMAPEVSKEEEKKSLQKKDHQQALSQTTSFKTPNMNQRLSLMSSSTSNSSSSNTSPSSRQSNQQYTSPLTNLALRVTPIKSSHSSASEFKKHHHLKKQQHNAKYSTMSSSSVSSVTNGHRVLRINSTRSINQTYDDDSLNDTDPHSANAKRNITILPTPANNNSYV